MFSVEKVYTSLNADDAKAGSKGYFADDLGTLEKMVDASDTTRILEKVSSKNAVARFQPLNGSNCCLFYLVDEPHEKKFRPYNNTAEMVEDFKKRYNSYGGWSGKDNPMYSPLIWVKAGHNKYLIIRFTDDEVTVAMENSSYSMHLPTLLKDYTYLDGSPCGIEE